MIVPLAKVRFHKNWEIARANTGASPQHCSHLNKVQGDTFFSVIGNCEEAVAFDFLGDISV